MEAPIALTFDPILDYDHSRVPLTCPCCGHVLSAEAARGYWFRKMLGKPRAISCAKCGVRLVPSWRYRGLLDICLGSVFLVAWYHSSILELAIDEFGFRAGVVLSLIAVVAVAIGIGYVESWWGIPNWRLFEEATVPKTPATPPADLPPEVTENPDGTFSVGGRTYKSWKSAVDYLELYGRS